MDAVRIPAELSEAVVRARGADTDTEAARRALRLLQLTAGPYGKSREAVTALCGLAVGPGGPVASVRVAPDGLGIARRLLAAPVALATVVDASDAEAVRAVIADALESGADEVDLVYPQRPVPVEDRHAGPRLVRAARRACGESIRLGVLVEAGSRPAPMQLGEVAAIAIAEGADFVGTAAPVSGPAAGTTLEEAAVLLDRVQLAGRRVGLKLSGDVAAGGDAARFLALARQMMGPGFLAPGTLRLEALADADGASDTLDALQRLAAG